MGNARGYITCLTPTVLFKSHCFICLPYSLYSQSDVSVPHFQNMAATITYLTTILISVLCAASVVSGTTYERVPYGFANCVTEFMPLQTGVSEADMIKLATEVNADGFTYHPALKYGQVLKKPYDRSCQSAANQSWPLYLSKIPYTKMPYGMNNCKTTFGPLRTGVSEDDMVHEASANGADGFAYHSTLKYGRVLKKPYDRSCQSPANESWPLYLRTIKYVQVAYGFNRCKAVFGPNLHSVSEEHMARLANQAGADGFTYHPSLKYGAVLLKPYDRSCQSPTNQSWPLFLSVKEN